MPHNENRATWVVKVTHPSGEKSERTMLVCENCLAAILMRYASEGCIVQATPK